MSQPIREEPDITRRNAYEHPCPNCGAPGAFYRTAAGTVWCWQCYSDHPDGWIWPGHGDC